MQNRDKKRTPQLLLLAVIFLIPMLSSYFLYHYHGYFQLKTSNRGMLIKPPIDVEYLYEAMQGAHKNKWHKKWRIIHITDKDCNAACQKVNYQLGQVQKALGKESHRVELVAMNANAPCKELTKAFVQRGEKNFIVKNKIYLADPLGNLFMYYSSNADPMNILKDLKKVLEVSQIG